MPESHLPGLARDSGDDPSQLLFIAYAPLILASH